MPRSADDWATPLQMATPPVAGTVDFEYFGPTLLRTVGLATRRHYWFGHTGARVAVDARDAPGLDGIPNLRRVAPR